MIRVYLLVPCTAGGRKSTFNLYATGDIGGTGQPRQRYYCCNLTLKVIVARGHTTRDNVGMCAITPAASRAGARLSL